MYALLVVAGMPQASSYTNGNTIADVVRVVIMSPLIDKQQEDKKKSMLVFGMNEKYRNCFIEMGYGDIIYDMDWIPN
jgi:hypothetical protein